MSRLRLVISVVVAGLIAVPCAQAAGIDLRAYEVQIRIGPDGAATAVADLRFENAAPGPVAVPLGFAGVTVVRVTEPAGVTATVEALNGQSLVRFVLPEGTTGEVHVVLAFDVPRALERTDPGPGERATLPAGTRLFKHALLNTQAATIGRYRLGVVFPDDLRAHAVREWLPKLRKGEAGPRVRLDNIDAQHGAVLAVDRLQLGETASVTVELIPLVRSLSWLLVGAALSLVYLIVFRDLVYRRPNSGAPAA